MLHRNLRVTVMGLGHFGGGVAAARWLARRGAIVTVTELADERILKAALESLAGESIHKFRLAGHQADDFRNADLVVVNPAVRPGDRFVEIARESGARLTTEIELFLESCPAPIVAVTGSNGKSTTSAMTAAILNAAGFRTWLGGNLGGSLLDDLEQIAPTDRVVLEISSFQLWRLNADTLMPQVAVVTGCTPNHLDWHRDFSDYAAAKQRLLAGQRAEDTAVLNTFDSEVASWTRLVRGRLLPLPPIESLPVLRVPGTHNRINAACASAAAMGAGCGESAIRQGLAEFAGLPQRLEWFADIDGRSFYNDSSATTPESVIAALLSLDSPVWLLLGGHDKGLDFEPLLATISRRAIGVAFYGSVARQLHDRMKSLSPNFRSASFETMEESLDWCWRSSRSGDAILLSPACSSHDQFRNFRERGERFVEMVGSLCSRMAATSANLAVARSDPTY